MRHTPDPHPALTLRFPGSLPWTALAVSLFVGLFASVAPPALHACSCMPPASASAELAKADAVFVGRAVSVVTEEREVAEIRSFFSQLHVTFELQRVWKGVAEGDTVTVTTAADGAACGYGFRQGETYLVYGYQTRRNEEAAEGSAEESGETPFTTNLCTRNAPLAQAGEDVAALGEPMRTLPR